MKIEMDIGLSVILDMRILFMQILRFIPIMDLGFSLRLMVRGRMGLRL